MAVDPTSSDSIRRGSDPSPEVFDSDALRINLEETAVDQVAVDPKYRVLQETVSGYRGIVKSLDILLFELNHPFKNWEIILPELRSFALKHFSSYSRHPKGSQAVSVMIEVFLDALRLGGLAPGARGGSSLRYRGPGRNLRRVLR